MMLDSRVNNRFVIRSPKITVLTDFYRKMVISRIKATSFAILLAIFKSGTTSIIPKSQIIFSSDGNDLYDFLTKVSNAHDDLDKSEVFGLYTMQFSSPDAMNVVEKSTLAQCAWIDHAIKVGDAEFGMVVRGPHLHGSILVGCGKGLGVDMFRALMDNSSGKCKK